MPAPPPSHSQEGHAWRESNKTQAEHPRPLANQDAYQYTGTRYGNQDFAATSNAFSTQHQDTAPTHTQPTSQPVDTASVHTDTRRTGRPSRLRLLLRTILFVASVGHLGFAAGASPYSNQPVPFDNRSCFYYLFAVVCNHDIMKICDFFFFFGLPNHG
ncbi:uncharacterized protein BYT42DRAFT_492176 [Radiomyces spectabilis]|uniref:uncharacterized protein n=1 Tax=Radiomyces spectabilis TaxID=64574 RepID=UPI00221FB02A|nr:uncharacterized protein BYT42DRAFT_492176 [Radiomyces spectabilis]KAI8388604.1 hypothetical protein BYT42DRAFT_492176 [Radiomyces spectabilis]